MFKLRKYWKRIEIILFSELGNLN
ncbi:MAG: hypothetical protein EU531_05585 [Promethearchaeota archaeon]|nr:MAG: hypothetical protein EU531_05585 [Candidatus Lokiarchaeota archaeon]